MFVAWWFLKQTFILAKYLEYVHKQLYFLLPDFIMSSYHTKNLEIIKRILHTVNNESLNVCEW